MQDSLGADCGGMGPATRPVDVGADKRIGPFAASGSGLLGGETCAGGVAHGG